MLIMAKLCGAKSNSNESCKNFAMQNGKCYMHGGATPAKHSNHNAKMNALKHGKYSAEIIASKKALYHEFKDFNEIVRELFKHSN